MLAARQSEPLPSALAATDGELMMRFVRHRDRAAIGELVQKHAPMVMAVCRQILGSRMDAEDAFQATFLILARRAGSIERKSSVAGWLYRVAHRTAMRLARRRRSRKTEPLVEEPPGDFDVFSIIHQRELQRVLHEELECLPARYRDPIVLMYFAGLSREQIAEELECTDAAVKGRLARGRKVLRLALARRGVGLSVAVGVCLATAPATAAALPVLVDKTIRACTSLFGHGGGVAPACSTQAIQLANEGVRAMMIATAAKALFIPAALGVAIMAAAQIPGDEPADSRRTRIAAGQVALAGAADLQGAARQPRGDDAAISFVAPAADPSSNETTQSAPAASGISGLSSNTAIANEGPSATEAPHQLKLNIRGEPWVKVLELFAEDAGLSLDWQELPSGTYNYSDTDGEFTVPQAMDQLNKHLLYLGFTLVRTGETLAVVNLGDELDKQSLRDLLPITPLEDLHRRGDYEMTKMLFDLQNVDAQVVADEINPLLHHPQGAVVVMPQARQILVMDTGATLRAVHGVIRRLKSTPAGRNLGDQVIQLGPNLTPFGDANPPSLQDVSGLDAANLQILEDYYSQRARASEARQEAKKAEISAYGKSGSERERELDTARQLSAEADLIDLRAEETLFNSRVRQLREQREQRQQPTEPGPPAAVLAPGDRLLVRLHVSAAEPSQNVNEVARVEAGGTLPLGPILGRVQVAGKTLLEAEDEVRKAVAKYYRDAAVQVTNAADTPSTAN